MSQQQKLETAITMLVELGKGNFSARTEVTDDDDPFNIVLSGLNMLGEELSGYRQKLNENSALLEETFQNISEIVCSIEVPCAGSGHARFEFISPRVKCLLGYEEAMIYNDASLWFSAIHPGDMGVIEQGLEQLLRGEQVSCEYRIRHKDKDYYFWVESIMSPVPSPSGQGCRAFCTVRDITSRVEAQKERDRLILELNAKYNEQMQFTYIVSHNLRSPVAGILGACELFNYPLSDEEQKQALIHIREAAGRLDNLLRDLNTILSTKSQLHERFEEFSLEDVVDSVRAMLTEQIKQSAAFVEVNIAQGADRMKSIKGYIQSCIYNLASNAIKYRRKDVRPEIKIHIWYESGFKYIRVSDNGMGIDLEKHGDQLFGLYRRFNTELDGKGLGLHMTKVQIEAIGGIISVVSNPGEGSTFTVVVKDELQGVQV